jgi:hypothetical protein
MSRTIARGRSAIVVATLLVSAPLLFAQSNAFQFVVSVLDPNGRPVSDLTRDEIILTENGIADEIVKVEPFAVPVELTVAVDNGPLSADSLGHYRNGLTGLVKALPGDVEITLITMSPQPFMVVRPTTDRIRLLRGLTNFAPQADSPRFTDTLVEFSKRYEDELRRTGKIDSVPVLLMVSTSVTEAVSYQPPEITKALSFLEQRKAFVHVAMLNINRGTTGLASLDEGRQTLIAIPATKVTRGRYESLANGSRLVTLLPEIGAQIAMLHRRQISQLLVTAYRRPGLKGQLQNAQIGLTRKDLKGSVSLDGLPR